MLASEMVAAVKGQVGFDTSGANVSDATVLSWLNAKYREFCARSKFLKVTGDLGPTVAGTAKYDIDAGIVEILALRVGDLEEAVRVGHEDMWALRAGTASLSGSSRVAYAPQFTSGGQAQVEIYPTPTEGSPLSADGEAIEVLYVALPAALTTSPDAEPVIPADFHEAIVQGAVAMGLERTDARFDLSAGFNAQFEAAIALCKRRATTRVGQGPTQFKVAGVHF